jgi:hypothetical protein
MREALIASQVGQTPRSAADALVGLLLDIKKAGPGVRRGRGPPPYILPALDL